jgi:hypothetical protein
VRLRSATPRVRKSHGVVPRRRSGRIATIAIGDIHGNLPALNDLLGIVAPEVRAGDTVVFLGDYIDRGSSSRQCLPHAQRDWGRIPERCVSVRVTRWTSG